MNYIRQLNGFARMRKSVPLCASAICLYFVLMEYANSLGFPKKMKASNAMLKMLSALPLSSLQRGREELLKKGYIKYKKGTGKQDLGEYEIVNLCDGVFGEAGTNTGSYLDTKAGTNACTKAGTNAGTNNKLNINKNKNKNIFNNARDNGWHDYDIADIERRALARSLAKNMGEYDDEDNGISENGTNTGE